MPPIARAKVPSPERPAVYRAGVAQDGTTLLEGEEGRRFHDGRSTS